MPANSNVPLGTVPWRLTAASPGTLDIHIDVEDPVSWDAGGTGPQFVDPITGTVPVPTGVGLQQMARRGVFKFFVPDTANRDDVIEAIITARLDNVAPYYTWSALDGGETYKVRFDVTQNLKIGYLGPHRTIDVPLVEVLSNAPTSNPTGGPPPSPTTPFVTASPTTVVNNGKVYVAWGNIATSSPADFIAACLKSNPDIGNSNRFGSLTINAPNGSGTLTFDDPSGETIYEIRMYLGVGPKIVIGTTISKTTGATLNISNPPDYSIRILSASDIFHLDWAGIPTPTITDTVVAEYYNGSSWVNLATHSTGNTANGSTTFTVPSMPPYNAITPVRFRLTTSSPDITVTAAGFSGAYVSLNTGSPNNAIFCTWAGIKILDGAQIGIIPSGQTSLDNAYMIQSLPDKCSAVVSGGGMTFDLGFPPNFGNPGDVVGVCIVEGDGTTHVSPQGYILVGDGS